MQPQIPDHTVDLTFSLLDADKSTACGKVRALAKTHLAQIDQKIESLQRLRGRLNRLIEHCDEPSSSDRGCPILTSLEIATVPAHPQTIGGVEPHVD